MDIEDLFNEDASSHLYEESKEAPMIIPDFGPCSVDGGDDDDQESGSASQ